MGHPKVHDRTVRRPVGTFCRRNLSQHSCEPPARCMDQVRNVLFVVCVMMRLDDLTIGQDPYYGTPVMIELRAKLTAKNYGPVEMSDAESSKTV